MSTSRNLFPTATHARQRDERIKDTAILNQRSNITPSMCAFELSFHFSPLPSLSLCGINHYTGPRNVNLRRINTDKYETVQQSRKGGGIKGTQQAEECAPSTTKLERQRTFSSPRRYLFSACAESCRDVVDARGRRR